MLLNKLYCPRSMSSIDLSDSSAFLRTGWCCRTPDGKPDYPNVFMDSVRRLPRGSVLPAVNPLEDFKQITIINVGNVQIIGLLNLLVEIGNLDTKPGEVE